MSQISGKVKKLVQIILSNRILSLRILGTLTIMLLYIPAYNNICWTRDEEWIFTWADVSSWILLIIFIVAISESEEPPARVRKMIPKNRWLRIPAWLFYPGSAGGICWYAVNSSLMIFLYYRAYDKYLPTQWYQPWYAKALAIIAAAYPKDIFARYFTVTGIETSAYQFKAIAALGLIAILLRLWFLKKILPNKWTGLLMICLVFAVVMFGGILEQAVNPSADVPVNIVDYPWLSLNFIGTLSPWRTQNDTFIQIGNNVYRNLLIVITLLLLPWFWRQIKNFKPLPESLPTDKNVTA